MHIDLFQMDLKILLNDLFFKQRKMHYKLNASTKDPELKKKSKQPKKSRFSSGLYIFIYSNTFFFYCTIHKIDRLLNHQ
jgi:hypothetical protein